MSWVYNNAWNNSMRFLCSVTSCAVHSTQTSQFCGRPQKRFRVMISAQLQGRCCAIVAKFQHSALAADLTRCVGSAQATFPHRSHLQGRMNTDMLAHVVVRVYPAVGVHVCYPVETHGHLSLCGHTRSNWTVSLSRGSLWHQIAEDVMCILFVCVWV